jgi:putative transposase
LKKRHTPEQIVRKLREADAELAAGASNPEVTRKLGISEATLHRWRNQYGGMKADEILGEERQPAPPLSLYTSPLTEL